MDQGWTYLPKHIIDSISEKLESNVDFLQYGAACLPWHSIMKENQVKRSTTLCDHQVPLLLVPTEEEHIWRLYNALESKYLNLSLAQDQRFSGSSQGWLIMSNEDHTISLHKPSFVVQSENCIADKNILLPYLPPNLEVNHSLEESEDENENENEDENENENENGYEDDYEDENEDEEGNSSSTSLSDLELYPLFDDYYCYNVLKGLITADPQANQSNCTIAVIFGTYCHLAIMRYGIDKTWTIIEGACYRDFLYYKNRFYALVSTGKLKSFDVENPSTVKTIAYAPKPSVRDLIKTYLVESCGEILLVERCIECTNKCRDRITKLFKIYKLDFERGKWVEKKSLGDVALFVGDSSTISVLASNFKGCKPNSIYFTHDEIRIPSFPKTFGDLGIYDVENRSFEFGFTLDYVAFSDTFRKPPIWLVPVPRNI